MPSKPLKTLATAESCTGGLLGARITDTPGASRFYKGGVVAYHDGAKHSLLGVPRALLRKYGAVSAETAQGMARGVRRKFRADIGVAITGIAGPDGGSKTKPVGLVYIALSARRETAVKKFLFRGSRQTVRRQAASKALAWFRRAAR